MTTTRSLEQLESDEAALNGIRERLEEMQEGAAFSVSQHLKRAQREISVGVERVKQERAKTMLPDSRAEKADAANVVYEDLGAW